MTFYASPLFIDILLIVIYAMLAGAIGLVAWSAFRSLKKRGSQTVDLGFPAKRIVWGVAALLFITLSITSLFADTTPIIINGKTYSDAFWLRISDILINTSLVLIVAAVCCVIGGALWAGRRKHV
jgi:hypothetical protein